MEYVFVIDVEVGSAYDLGDGNIEQDTEEVEVYVKSEDFESNKEVKEMYVDEFMCKYNITKESAYDLLDDYGLWFEDEEMVDSILKNGVDDLKRIFQEETNERIEDFYYSRGCR